MNLAQRLAILKKDKTRILDVCPDATDKSGIYIMTREEDGFRYAYVGQAKKMLTRLAQHLSGYQHIDLSLKKHRLYSENNKTGWKITTCEFDENILDDMERELIKSYADLGYQLRNKTSGGQDCGKKQIDEYKPSKTYRDGLLQGYANARKEVKKLFEKNLTFAINGSITKPKQKAFDKFTSFLGESNETDDG